MSGVLRDYQDVSTTNSAPTAYSNHKEQALDDNFIQNNPKSKCPNPFLDSKQGEYWLQRYSSSKYENIIYYDPTLKWTAKEEKKLLNKLNLTIMVVLSFMWLGFFINKSNFQDAVRAGMPYDIDMNIYVYNGSTSISNFKPERSTTRGSSYLSSAYVGEALTVSSDTTTVEYIERATQIIFAIPSVLVAKKIGPDIWLPILLCVYCALGCWQAAFNQTSVAMGIKGAMGAVGAGFIPSTVLYLSYFFTADQLAMRLACLWIFRTLAEIITGYLIYACIRIEYAPKYVMDGWRFAFMIEGVVTFVGALICSFFLPRCLSKKQKWQPEILTEREKEIQINSILRDDPSKGVTNNTSIGGAKEVVKSLLDFDLYPLYAIGLVALIPYSCYEVYLLFVIKQWIFFHQSIAQYSLRTIWRIILIIFITPVTKISEVLNERSLVCLVFFGIWQIPLTAVMTWWEKSISDYWGSYPVVILALGAPNIIAILQSWVSRNSGSNTKRAISSALFMMFFDAGYMISKNVYKFHQLPRLREGSLYNFIIILILCVLLVATKGYYIIRNKMKLRNWENLNESDQDNYLAKNGWLGNRTSFFQYSH
ncbi:putative transporter [Wickerhamomyces ciferrii]|uniref:Transporter n=1 Tax=Wickerhamomyces ciferrii (strain ATCC 14091 / BCRC 22168 / CBS 111 / JCM 3599 / NBRC 0793 / NRRL Y-1031 F-60-10) TaxID=1206466 RepID=K0KP95_WICCF|nr:putative transporter [Wickerhamomyces ciferrii]CCH43209.1 putative transporter [Wickerhamomyces ciferrii]